jgi:hypothetical protein
MATIANAPNQQQALGSVNLTAPTGFHVVSASVPSGSVTSTDSTVQLRSLALAPGRSVVVTIVADIPCTTGTTSWTARGKQSNDFNGPPGNDFTLASGSSLTTSVTGACALRFATQPTNARVGQVITGTAYTPTGPGVSVQTVDGSGNPIARAGTPITMALGAASGLGTLGGTKTVNTGADGIATFGDLTISAAGTYTLRASTTSAAGFTSVSSNTFKIDAVAVSCAENASCTASLSDRTTKLDATADPDPNANDAGVLTLSFGGGASLDCSGYTEFSPDTAIITYSTDTRTKTVTETIDKSQMNLFPNNGASFLNVCFGSPVPFTTADGSQATVQASYDWDGNGTLDPVYVGLLPDCGARPCVSKRNKTNAGDGVITSLLPAGLGDPWHRA